MNKITNLLIISILLLLFVACKENKNQQNKPVIQNYVSNYYIIQGDTAKSKNTLVVVIDPHADGKKAALLFEDIAKIYNCTVIGLTDVQNNQQDFINRINNDVSAAINKHNLKVKEFYIAGFSGGARMAYAYAESYPSVINGLLMCGAGLPQNSKPEFPVAMIIGSRDPNFAEQYSSPYSQETSDNKIIHLSFNGKHEWPSKIFINTAMSFLMSLNGKNIPENIPDSLLKYTASMKDNADKFLYFRMLEADYKIVNSDKKQIFKQKIDSLIEDDNFYNYIKSLESTLSQEAERNQMYYNLLPVKDSLWWQKEIQKINEKINSKNILVKNSYARTKAFLGLVMYSLCGREIQNPKSQLIDKYLFIYKTLEPDNEDLKKFEQLRNSQKNQN